jgi:hypothetical protein
MVDEVGIVKGLRHSGVMEEFAHFTAVAGRALSRGFLGSEKIGEYLG